MSALSVIARKRGGTAAFDFHASAYGTCLLDLDALDLTTLQTSSTNSTPVANGVAFGRWADKSGLAHHADGSGAAQPARNDASINGHPSVLYAAGNALKTPAFAVSDPKTIYVVGYGTSSSNDYFISGQTGSTADIYIPSPTSVSLFVNSGGLAITVAATTTPAVICGVFNGGSGSVIRYNSSEVTGALLTGTETAGMTVGAYSGTPSNSLIGGIGRVLVYNTAHTLAMRNAIQAALQGLWGTP